MVALHPAEFITLNILSKFRKLKIRKACWKITKKIA
jgi:hypothetical protein